MPRKRRRNQAVEAPSPKRAALDWTESLNSRNEGKEESGLRRGADIVSYL